MASAMSGLATGRKLGSSESFLAGPPLVVGLIIHFGVIFLCLGCCRSSSSSVRLVVFFFFW